MAANEWARDSHGWMYMAGSGKITRSRWIQWRGSWYYLKANGYMATGTQKIGSRTYRFDSSGRWIR
jgi:glucan-binding YG repeat protein